MTKKRILSIVAGIQLLPFIAHAQEQAQATADQNPAWSNFFWGILPFVILILIAIPLLRNHRLIVKRSVQHMDRVEQSLDRILKLLEKKD